MANNIFAVCAEQPVRGDAKAFKYSTAEAAEKAARRIVTGRGMQMGIWHHAGGKAWPVEIATVLKDPLDRVWTQVAAGPGQQAFL